MNLFNHARINEIILLEMIELGNYVSLKITAYIIINSLKLRVPFDENLEYLR